MFALGLSYARLLARLAMERWKVVEVWPSFSRDANKPLDCLRFCFSGEDEMSELIEGNSYEKAGSKAGRFRLVKRLAKY